MKTNRYKKFAEKILSSIDVKIDGSRSWDIQIHNDKSYQRVLSQGAIGLGESYMEGWWDCEKLDELIFRIINKDIEKKIGINWRTALVFLIAKSVNLQSKLRAFHVGEKHYNLGNDLFMSMLDERLIYSCAYWKNAHTLGKAQEAKLDLVCRKIGLQPGMRMLDIGCGWGGLLKYAAEKYKVKAVGITVSKEQAKLGRELCKGFPIELRLQDYRDLDDKFDCVTSLGMFEHVGYKNYRAFMEIVHKNLKTNGLFLLHTIGGNISGATLDSWGSKYIFPNSMLPSIKQIGNAIEGLFVMEDWHNFGADYDKTLMAWFANFDKNWDKIKANYSSKFYRMWKYFLLSYAGTFRSRKTQLWQIVLSKKGVPRGYESIR